MKPIIYSVHGRNVEIPEEYAHLIEMKTRQIIASEYNISVRVLNRLIKEHGVSVTRKRFLYIEEVIEIYLVLNWPMKMRQPVNHTNSLTPPLTKK